MEYKLNNNEGFLITKSGESVDVLDSLNTDAEVIAEALVKISQRLNIVHYEAIDLGLPSGTKWANMNIGATCPEDAGLYFQWGDTEGFSKDSGKYCGGDRIEERVWKGEYAATHGCMLGDDQNIPVDPYFDAARKNMGAPWRMPTQAEMNELCNSTYTTWTWTQRNDMNGYLVVSKVNGNSIFLPAVGYFYEGFNSFGDVGTYWESSSSGEEEGCELYFDSTQFSSNYTDHRYCGYPVRAVQ